MSENPQRVKALILCAILCLAATLAQAEERCVLVELITFVECHACPDAEAALDSLSEEYPDSSLAIIRYHPRNAPANPFYQLDAVGRKNYYGVSYYPTTFFDGGMMFEGADDSSYYDWKDSIEVRLGVPSPLELAFSVAYDTLGRLGRADVELVAADSLEDGDLSLRFALIESGLQHSGDIFNEVLRDMFPDNIGVSFDLAEGDTFNYTMAFTMDSLWIAPHCALVLFVQDDITKEVLQSAQKSYSQWGPPLPIPKAAEGLSLLLSISDVSLSWSAVTEDWFGYPLSVDYYRVYRDTSRCYLPGFEVLLDSTANTMYWDDAAGHVGDLEANCFYYVTAVASGRESEPSLVVGEIDHRLFKLK